MLCILKENITRQSLNWNAQGTRKIGRPKKILIRTIETETKTAGKIWAEIEKTSQNWDRSRSVGAALFFPQELQELSM
jgi:hypothetical protein